MSLEKRMEELQERLKRREAMLKWDQRILKMNIGLKEFCDKYGFSDSHICHQKAGRRGATPEHFASVEKALKKEGV